MPKKLNIGLVLDDTLDSTDGVQQYVLTLGEWLGKQGHEVHYLVGESNRKDLKNLHSMTKNIKVRFNKNRLSIPLPTNQKLIKQKLKELKLDVLHVQMPYSPMMAGKLIAAVPEETRVIGTFHIVPATWFHSFGAIAIKNLNKKTAKRFDKIISVSVAAKIFAKDVFKIDSVVIPNAINLDKLSHKPIFKKTLTIIFLGRLVERKGCRYLLKALEKLQNNCDVRYKVIIGGKGPLRNKLESYTAKKQIKNVEFIGYVDESDKAKLLASADIAVFPSTGGESFGISLIEAMQAGSRVVLGGDNVGYCSILSGFPGLLVDPKDSETFAQRLKYFLEHEKVRIRAQKWAAKAVKKYDIKIIGKQIEDIYKTS